MTLPSAHRERSLGIPNRERTPAFGTKELPFEPNVTARDGYHVRDLLSLPSGAAAHLELPPGVVSGHTVIARPVISEPLRDSGDRTVWVTR